MFNSIAHQFNTLNAAHAYAEKHDDPVGVIKILLGQELEDEACDHSGIDCNCGEPDWDLMAKDEELMD